MEKMPLAFSSSSSGNEIEIITPSAAQSSSGGYDVFISHRGKDVKLTLASHMYNILKDCGVRVFLDKPEMQPGESITSQIQDAIRTASVNVAIFSENYARSSWCLDELCWMTRTPTKLLPVFYDVEPSDLRWTDKVDGVYAKSLRELEEKQRYNSRRIGEWKKALFDASNRSGFERKAFNGDDGALVKYIVHNVLKRIERAPLEVAKHPVGLNELTEDFELTLLQERNEECCKVVGIVGMGGAGKTTLAKHLFNVKRSHYEKSCFLFDIRSKDLKDLQRELLKELSGRDMKICHTSEGIGIFNKYLSISYCRALIVLDDIDHRNQLDELLAVKDVVSSDSLIILTSRYKDVLRQSGITFLYDIKNLNERQAQELFCWHAFLRPFPLQGFEDLVERFLTACHGLPLSLKVLGGQLYGNSDKNYWECQLEKISNIIHPDIKKILKVSYDALDRNDKQIFLDIACFFIGEDKSTAIRIWDGCDWNGWSGLQLLEHRCLIDFDKRNRIKMHDHLRDLGRDIVDEHCSENPNMPRRLWRPTDVNDLLERRSVTMQAIRGIVSTTDVGWSEPSRTNFGWYNRWIELFGNCVGYWCRLKFGITGSFGGVRGLQLLVGESDLFKGILNSTSSRSLVWLRWHRCPHKSLPAWLSMDKLRVLELVDGSLETLWNDHNHNQIPTQLRELRVESSSRLTKIPTSIGVLNHLEKIDLRDSSTKTLPEEFCRLHSLKHLQLEFFQELQSLPERFGDLTNLQRLDLRYCDSLQTLPESFGRLIQLRYLRLGCRNLLIQRDILGQISTLEYIDFDFCEKLEVLPSQITGQQCLEEISLDCTSLKELPNEIGELGNLKALSLSTSFLTSLPPSLWNLSNLVELFLSDCPELKCLPQHDGLDITSAVAVECVRNVEDEEAASRLRVSKTPALPKLEYLFLRSTKICSIYITQDVYPNLTTLDLLQNRHLVEVEVSVPTLETLSLRDCSVLRRITGLSCLAKLSDLDIGGCGELEEMPNVANLSCLKCLKAEGCWKLKSIEGVARLSSLETLRADGCWNLRSLRGVEQLERLKDLQLSAGDGTICNDIRWLQRLPPRLSTTTLTTRTIKAEDCGVEGIVRSFSVSFTLLELDVSTDGPLGKAFKLQGLSNLKSCTAAFLCFFVMTASDRPAGSVEILGELSIDLLVEFQRVYVKEGEWISMSIFTRDSAFLRELRTAMTSVEVEPHGGVEVKKGWMAMGGVGEDGTILELWNKLIGYVLH